VEGWGRAQESAGRLKSAPAHIFSGSQIKLNGAAFTVVGVIPKADKRNNVSRNREFVTG